MRTRSERNFHFLISWGRTSAQGVLHARLSGQAWARVLEIFVSLRWAGYLLRSRNFSFFSSGGESCARVPSGTSTFCGPGGKNLVKEFSILTCRGKPGHACLTFLFLCDGLGASGQKVSPFFAREKTVHTSRAELLLFELLGANIWSRSSPFSHVGASSGTRA